jgi:putative peptide modification system cyclase
MANDPPEIPTETGEEFIFVCYSHANQETVDAEIEWLREQGHTVWYDAHIPGGAEWNDELALRIQRCNWFLYFVSPESVSSGHCRNELNYAQQHGRRMLAVELEPTEVPAGLQLMLNARQILFRHRLPGKEFRRRLADALSSASEPGARPGASLDKTPARRTRNFKWAAMAVGLLLLVAALVAYFYRIESEPEIDFEERDAVVVGNLKNRTQDPQLGEALETTLRIALEQSKFATILATSVIRDAKARMELDPDAPLEREAAIELAQREDAKVSVVGEISQLGGSYTISIEMLSASTGASLWSGSSHAENLDQVLPAVDEISRQVRKHLGESLSSIAASSLPLAKVTTADLEALRAYSLGEKSVASGDWEAGLKLFQRAIEIDPEFAMAHGKIAALYIAYALQPQRAAEHYELALQYKSRLSPREQTYLEASSAWQKTPPDMYKAWKAMTALFPNEAVGFNNLGEVLKRYYLDFEGAQEQYRQSTERRAPWRHVALYNQAQSLLALNRSEEALETFKASYALDGNPVLCAMADAYTVLGRHDEALEFLSSVSESGAPGLKQAAQLRFAAVYADLGELEKALEITNRMLENATSPDQVSRAHAARVALLERLGDDERFQAAMQEALSYELGQLREGAAMGERNILARVQVLTRIAVRTGSASLAEDALTVIRERVPNNGFPVDQAWYELLEAEVRLQQGDAEGALEHARRSIDRGALFQAHETLARIHSTLGDEAARTAELTWMVDNRGRAFAEPIDWSYGQLFNILDWSIANGGPPST